MGIYSYNLGVYFAIHLFVFRQSVGFETAPKERFCNSPFAVMFKKGVCDFEVKYPILRIVQQKK